MEMMHKLSSTLNITSLNISLKQAPKSVTTSALVVIVFQAFTLWFLQFQKKISKPSHWMDKDNMMKYCYNSFDVH